MKADTTVKVRLTPLTAVHIGTGRTLNKLEYSIRPRKEGLPAFMRYQPDAILESLDDKGMQEFMRLADESNLGELATFFDKHLTNAAMWYLGSTTSKFHAEYKQRLNDFMNRLEIEELYRAPGQKHPVIPGSSIKGALRTALLNSRVEAIDKTAPGAFDGFRNSRDRFDSKFQREVLGFTKPNDDPFRMIRVGDCPIDPRGTQLVGQLFQYKPFRRDGVCFDSTALYAEVIRGLMTGSEQSAEFEIQQGDTVASAVVPPHSKALRDREGQPLFQKKVTVQEILEAADSHYYRYWFYKEYNKFYNEAEDSAIRNAADKLADLVDELHDKGNYLVRIGRWSHIESVTVKGLASPRGRHGYGKTRTLLEYEGSYLPMGWCSLEVVR